MARAAAATTHRLILASPFPPTIPRPRGLAPGPTLHTRRPLRPRPSRLEKSRPHHQLTRVRTRGLITRKRCGSRRMYAVVTAKGLAAPKEAAPGHTQKVLRLFIDRLTPSR